MRQLIGVILFIIILILSTVFALNNNHMVMIDYLIGNREISMSLLVAACTLIGLLLGLIIGTWALMKSRVQLRLTKKKLSKLETEINNLRTLPVKDTV